MKCISLTKQSFFHNTSNKKKNVEKDTYTNSNLKIMEGKIIKEKDTL